MLHGVLASGIRSRSAGSLPASDVEHSPPTADPALGTYSLSIDSGSFKSIKGSLEWPEVPAFAVITGLNGSGKSQLLRAIAMQYNGELRRYGGGTADLKLKIDGLTPNPHEVLFLEDFAKPLSSALSSVAYLEERIRQYREGGSQGNVYEGQIAGVLRNPTTTFTYANLHEVFYYNPSLLERAIAHHFVAYKIHRAVTAERLYDEKDSDTDIATLVGKPPWDDINEWFATAGFPYRVEPPTGIEPSTAHFRLQMRHTETNDVVALEDLSSGEASIVRFLFMMFAASKNLFWLKYYCWTNQTLTCMLA